MERPQSRPIVWAPLALALYAAGGCGPPVVRPRAALTGHGGNVVAVAFAPDGRTLASRGGDHVVRLWVDGAADPRATLAALDCDRGSLAFAPDGRTLATTDTVGVVTWDLAAGRPGPVYRHPPREPDDGCYSSYYGEGVAYAPDGTALAAGGNDGGPFGYVTVWDVATGAAATPVSRFDGAPLAVAFSPDGKTLAWGGYDGMVTLYDRAARAETGRLCLTECDVIKPPNRVTAIAYSPDGTTLAWANSDGRVLLQSRDCCLSGGFGGHKGRGVYCLAFSPDGRTVASGGAGGTLLLWDVKTRAVRARLVGHEGAVLAVAFRPDGGLLASGGADRMVRWWDVARVVQGGR